MTEFIEGLHIDCDAYDCIKYIEIPIVQHDDLSFNHGWTILELDNLYYCPTCTTKLELITNEQQRPS